MPTLINRHRMRAILTHLDRATAAVTLTERPGFESNAAWSLRMAREMLLEAAIADVAVEAAEPA